MKRIVLASTNKGKLKEFGEAFKSLGIELVSIGQYSSTWDVEETGTTFFANAQLKAEAAMNITGLPALADDSGLSVYYMGGAPGVYSQRFAGPNSTDQSNNELLLERLAFAKNYRQAHFSAVLAYARPGAATQFALGRLYGSITTAPRGDLGFGYDPIFQIRGTSHTLAEITLEQKNRISHRALALQSLVTSCGAFRV